MEVSQGGSVDRAALTHLILQSCDKSVVYLPFVATKVIILIKARAGNFIIFTYFAVRSRMTLKVYYPQKFAIYLAVKSLQQLLKCKSYIFLFHEKINILNLLNIFVREMAFNSNWIGCLPPSPLIQNIFRFCHSLPLGVGVVQTCH